MLVRTFKPDNYRDCPIYFRNLINHWEYITVIKGEVYTAHIEIKPTLINRFLHLIGVEETRYSEQQTGAIIKRLRLMAQTTVDFIIGEKPKEEK